MEEAVKLAYFNSIKVRLKRKVGQETKPSTHISIP